MGFCLLCSVFDLFLWVYMFCGVFGIGRRVCLFMLFYVFGVCKPLYFCLCFIES